MLLLHPNLMLVCELFLHIALSTGDSLVKILVSLLCRVVMKSAIFLCSTIVLVLLVVLNCSLFLCTKDPSLLPSVLL